MKSKPPKQKSSFIKSKSIPSAGFRTPDHFKGKTAKEKTQVKSPKFNPAQFKTQHKG